MADIVIYSTTPCSYCVRAKRLLDRAQLEFEEINIRDTPEVRDDLYAKTGEMTLPQIFVKGVYIGQDDELREALASGRIKALLRGEPVGQKEKALN